MQQAQEEQLLIAWIGLTNLIKNSRLSGSMPYNEAQILMQIYYQYQEDEIGRVSLKTILEKTKMLKSLANRTIDSLESKGMIRKMRGEKDSRMVYLEPNPDHMGEFLAVHNHSLQISGKILELIGEEDAMAIVRIYEKLSARKDLPE